MKLKLIVSAALVGSVLMYSGVKPSDLLDQGRVLWEEFSGDFMAIFNVEGSEDIAVKEAESYVGKVAQAVCDAEPAATDDETSEIEREINRTRCEAAKNVKVIDLNPDELKQLLEERKRLLE